MSCKNDVEKSQEIKTKNINRPHVKGVGHACKPMKNPFDDSLCQGNARWRQRQGQGEEEFDSL